MTPEEIEDLYGTTTLETTAARMAGIQTPVLPSLDTILTGYNESQSSVNNGGSTDYYKLDPSWNMAQDIIEARSMNFSQGNILKAAFTFNSGRHEATSYERELNKIIWFAQRELSRIQSH